MNRSVEDETINREYVGTYFLMGEGYIEILGGRRGQYQMLGSFVQNGAERDEKSGEGSRDCQVKVSYW